MNSRTLGSSLCCCDVCSVLCEFWQSFFHCDFSSSPRLPFNSNTSSTSSARALQELSHNELAERQRSRVREQSRASLFHPDSPRRRRHPAPVASSNENQPPSLNTVNGTSSQCRLCTFLPYLMLLTVVLQFCSSLRLDHWHRDSVENGNEMPVLTVPVTSRHLEANALKDRPMLGH